MEPMSADLKVEPQLRIEIKEAFDLSAIFGCGQAFRWKQSELANGAIGFHGIVDGEAVLATQDQGNLTLMTLGTVHNKAPHTAAFWRHYFDCDRSYSKIRAEIRYRAPELGPALEFGAGIRLMNQDFFEMLITFIISANNNIPRIAASIQKLSVLYGEPIISELFNGQYSFPTPEALALADLEDLKGCGVGYRNTYIQSASRQWCALGQDKVLQSLERMSYSESKAWLQTFSGVGPKVADCILLFATARHDAFPIDTWIKKALSRYYDVDQMTSKEMDSFLERQFGELKGFAQQYIFHFERNSGLI